MVSNFFVSDIAALIDKSSRKSTKFQDKYDQTNMVMHEILDLDEVD